MFEWDDPFWTSKARIAQLVVRMPVHTLAVSKVDMRDAVGFMTPTTTNNNSGHRCECPHKSIDHAPHKCDRTDTAYYRTPTKENKHFWLCPECVLLGYELATPPSTSLFCYDCDYEWFHNGTLVDGYIDEAICPACGSEALNEIPTIGFPY